MNVITIILILFSGLSFIVYGMIFFTSIKMKDEFKRFGLEKFTMLTGILELLGGVGMLVGIKIPIVLLISSGGLAILMLLGFAVRIKMKDGFWLSFPSVFFMLINFYLFVTVAFINNH